MKKDSHLGPEWLMTAWIRATRKQGVMIDEGCRLKRFGSRNGRIIGARTTTDRLTADQFILAAGAWTPAMARQFDLRIPVQPGKGYSITMDRPAACPEIPCYLYENNVVVTPWKSGYRLGGTMEFSGFDSSLNQQRLAKLEQSAALYLQTPLGRRVIERWTGLRPMCVDDLPVIGRVPTMENLYIATGHGMLGLSTATATGRLITDMILGRPPIVDPKPFLIERFG